MIYDIKGNRKILYNKYNKKSYSVTTKEFEILTCYDGTNNLADISDLYSEIDYKSLEKLQNTFLQYEILEDENKPKVKKNTGILFTIYKLEQYISNKALCKVFEFIIIYFSMPLFLIGIGLNLNNIIHMETIFTQTSKIYKLSLILVFLITFIIGLCLHEIAHAIVAINQGALVPEVTIELKRGFILHAFTRILGMVFIKNARSKIKIYYAGIAIDFILSGILLIVYYFLNRSMILVMGISLGIQGMLNVSIFHRGDGYSILNETLNGDFLPKQVTPESMKKGIKSYRELIVFNMIGFITNFVMPFVFFLLYILERVN